MKNQRKNVTVGVHTVKVELLSHNVYASVNVPGTLDDVEVVYDIYPDCAQALAAYNKLEQPVLGPLVDAVLADMAD